MKSADAHPWLACRMLLGNHGWPREHRIACSLRDRNILHVLILGGSSIHLGGVETFCDRAAATIIQYERSITVTRIPTETAYLTVRRLPLIVRQLTALTRYRMAQKGVVWLHYVNLPDLIYLIAAKLLGFRVMVTPHLGANWRSQSNAVLRWLSGRILSLADRIALIAKTQESEINIPASIPRSLIRTFIPAEVLGPVPPEQDPPPYMRLIHASRLSEAKGSFLVIDVCAGLRDAGIPFSAKLVGGAEEAIHARLRQAIADHHLDNQVELIGWTPPATLMDYLRQSDVLVHLSTIDSYPLILLEAMACGTFPVALDLAGARDMINTYDGYIVSAQHAVRESISYLATADLKDLRQRSAEQAQRVRADFAWDQATQLLVAALMLTTASSTPRARDVS